MHPEELCEIRVITDTVEPGQIRPEQARIQMVEDPDLIVPADRSDHAANVRCGKGVFDVSIPFRGMLAQIGVGFRRRRKLDRLETEHGP